MFWTDVKGWRRTATTLLLNLPSTKPTINHSGSEHTWGLSGYLKHGTGFQMSHGFWLEALTSGYRHHAEVGQIYRRAGLQCWSPGTIMCWEFSLTVNLNPMQPNHLRKLSSDKTWLSFSKEEQAHYLSTSAGKIMQINAQFGVHESTHCCWDPFKVKHSFQSIKKDQS